MSRVNLERVVKHYGDTPIGKKARALLEELDPQSTRAQEPQKR